MACECIARCRSDRHVGCNGCRNHAAGGAIIWWVVMSDGWRTAWWGTLAVALVIIAFWIADRVSVISWWVAVGLIAVAIAAALQIPMRSK